MSCEWFIKFEPCGHCGRSDDQVKIGTSAIGWQFMFEEIDGATTFEAWRPHLEGRTIINEYGDESTFASFGSFVQGKAHLRCPRT